MSFGLAFEANGRDGWFPITGHGLGFTMLLCPHWVKKEKERETAVDSSVPFQRNVILLCGQCRLL